jgi:hypothetical protein
MIPVYKFTCEACSNVMFIPKKSYAPSQVCPCCMDVNNFTITGGYTVEGEEDEYA